MAKVNHIGKFIFLLCLMSCVANAQCIRHVYSGEIGIKEQGWNSGTRVRQYLKAVHLSEGNPWCAAFVVWCHKQCGYKIPETGYSPLLFPKEKTCIINPSPGDVFGIYFKNKGRIAHVGFIDKVENNGYVTVEGNTNASGSREGDGVYSKRRMKGQIYKIVRWNTER